MALHYLLDQGKRVLDATVNVANRHISALSAALQQQQAISMEMFTLLQRRDREADQVLNLTVNQDLQIRGLREQINTLQADLDSERSQHTQVKADLHRQQDQWDTWLPRIKEIIPDLVNETTSAVDVLHQHDMIYPWDITYQLKDKAMKILAEAPESLAPTPHVAFPDGPHSFPMVRQPAQRGHQVHPWTSHAVETYDGGGHEMDRTDADQEDGAVSVGQADNPAELEDPSLLALPNSPSAWEAGFTMNSRGAWDDGPLYSGSDYHEEGDLRDIGEHLRPSTSMERETRGDPREDWEDGPVSEREALWDRTIEEWRDNVWSARVGIVHKSARVIRI